MLGYFLMAFLVFDREQANGKGILHLTQDSYRLGGHNLIYRSWQVRGCPLNAGWHVTVNELIRMRFEDKQSYNTKRFLIDFDPRATWRIGLIELLDVYAFTWEGSPGEPGWTPLMLRMRDVFYKDDYVEPIDQAHKKSVLSNLDEPSIEAPDFVEFLYLNGSKYSWNWGRNGMTNAAFLTGAARKYFRQFF